LTKILTKPIRKIAAPAIEHIIDCILSTENWAFSIMYASLVADKPLIAVPIMMKAKINLPHLSILPLFTMHDIMNITWQITKTEVMLDIKSPKNKLNMYNSSLLTFVSLILTNVC
jgi:hypothetical protein